MIVRLRLQVHDRGAGDRAEAFVDGARAAEGTTVGRVLGAFVLVRTCTCVAFVLDGFST